MVKIIKVKKYCVQLQMLLVDFKINAYTGK